MDDEAVTHGPLAQPHENVGRAGVPARRRWWHRLPACRTEPVPPVSALKCSVSQALAGQRRLSLLKNCVHIGLDPGSQAPAWEPHCRQSSCFARASSIYCAIRPKQELGNQEKAGCAALSRPTGYERPRPPGGPHRLERPCRVRTAHHHNAQARACAPHSQELFQGRSGAQTAPASQPEPP